VVSNENLYFRSYDGAIVVLTSGNPQSNGQYVPQNPPSAANIQEAHRPTDISPAAVIAHT